LVRSVARPDLIIKQPPRRKFFTSAVLWLSSGIACSIRESTLICLYTLNMVFVEHGLGIHSSAYAPPNVSRKKRPSLQMRACWFGIQNPLRCLCWFQSSRPQHRSCHADSQERKVQQYLHDGPFRFWLFRLAIACCQILFTRLH
jgi:hypothetical protein